MYSIIVLSHGDLAYGFKDTMTMIAGVQEDIYFISFTPSDSVEDFEKKVKVIYRSILKEHQVLILTDLYGGTPNHIASALHLRYPERTEVISGVNLPLLLMANAAKNKDLKVEISNLLEGCHQGIQNIDVATKIEEDDE